VKPDGKLLEVQLARLKKAIGQGYDGLELDNMDQSIKAGDQTAMIDLWNKVCQATKQLKPSGKCVVKNSIEILDKVKPDIVIAEIEKNNREELAQFANKAGNKLHAVFYGTVAEAKSACQLAKEKGFKLIIATAKTLSAKTNKCCD